MRILVTGGAGFKGSALCRHLVSTRGATVLNVDRLSAGSSLASLDSIAASPRYALRKTDIRERSRIAALVQAFEPDAVIHLAGQSQMAGTETDTAGTCSLISAVGEYWSALTGARLDRFRFLQVSRGCVFDATGLAPADEAAIDWHRTFGLPVMVARAASVYGPCQALDGFVPQLVLAARHGQPMAVEGDGTSLADWLHVEDHARALEAMLAAGTPGTTYDVGAGHQRTDLAVAERVAHVMDRYAPAAAPHASLITFVANGPGPGQCCANDTGRLQRDTGWRPQQSFETALDSTVHWYLDNESWWRPLRDAHCDATLLGLRKSA